MPHLWCCSRPGETGGGMNDTFKYHDAEQQEHMCIALAKACLQTHVGSLHIHTCLGCQIPHIRTTNRGTHVPAQLMSKVWALFLTTDASVILCNYSMCYHSKAALFRVPWVEEQQISSLGSVDEDPHCRNIFSY